MNSTGLSDNEHFPFNKKFHNFSLGCKWKTYVLDIPRENSQEWKNKKNTMKLSENACFINKFS